VNSSKRPDYRLAVGYGSAWHILRCLGWQRSRFTAEVARHVGASAIEWLDFPASTGAQSYPNGIPIRDGDWTRIDFIDNAPVQRSYDAYWPSEGYQQNWDAVGKATIDGREEWLLVEAKAHTAEIKAKGTKAKEMGGRPMIREAFKETLAALGYDADASFARAEGWLTGYYQHANRLATLHFLTKQGIPARLIFLYFCGDQHPDGKMCPNKPADWKVLVDRINHELGLTGDSLLEQRVHEIFVQVSPKPVRAK
jgi:hypothetical protein